MKRDLYQLAGCISFSGPKNPNPRKGG
jgi:hypothetical protein